MSGAERVFAPMQSSVVLSNACEPVSSEQRRRIYEEAARSRFSEVSRKEAQATLQRPLPGSSFGTLLQLAHLLQMKVFLSHEHCTSLTRHWWRGGYLFASQRLSADFDEEQQIFSPLPEDMQGEPLAILRFLIVVAIPFVNPKILFAKKNSDRKESSVTVGTTDNPEAVFDTMAATLKIISAERKQHEPVSLPARRAAANSIAPPLPANLTSTRPTPRRSSMVIGRPAIVIRAQKRMSVEARLGSELSLREVAAHAANLSLEASKQQLSRLQAVRRRWVIYYRIPVIKFMVRFINNLAHIVLVLVMLLVITESECSDTHPVFELRRIHTTQGRFRAIEAICAYNELSLLTDHQYVIRGAGLSKTERKYHVFSSRGRKGDWLYNTRLVFVILATVFRAVSLGLGCDDDFGSGDNLLGVGSGDASDCGDAVLRARPYFEAYQTTVILSLTMQGLQLTSFLSIWSRQLGILIQTLRYMTTDLGIFLLLFFSITWPLMICYVGFARMGYYNSPIYETVGTEVHPRGELFFGLWAGLGQPQDNMYDQLEKNSVEQWIANILSVVTIFVGSVVLINLLIAMFSDVRTTAGHIPGPLIPSHPHQGYSSHLILRHRRTRASRGTARRSMSTCGRDCYSISSSARRPSPRA